MTVKYSQNISKIQVKYLQWQWSKLYGEEKFAIMFEGLHIENTQWSTLGDVFDCFGWKSVLTEATVAKSRISKLHLEAARIVRTRRGHIFFPSDVS